jgi:8-oxo-dGTP diphosphatase
MSEPRVGVGCILTRGGQVLLIRRKNVHGAGSWSTPGGHLEFGETPEQCAIRETLEEVGLTASGVRFLALTNDVFAESDKHYLTVWMHTVDFLGEPRVVADYEADEIGWFAWDALPAPLFISLANLVAGCSYPLGAIEGIRGEKLVDG